jgi:hypothetical protein
MERGYLANKTFGFLGLVKTSRDKTSLVKNSLGAPSGQV